MKKALFVNGAHVVMGAVFGGCRKVKLPPRELIVGFFAGETERSANSSEYSPSRTRRAEVEVSDL